MTNWLQQTLALALPALVGASAGGRIRIAHTEHGTIYLSNADGQLNISAPGGMVLNGEVVSSSSTSGSSSTSELQATIESLKSEIDQLRAGFVNKTEQTTVAVRFFITDVMPHQSSSGLNLGAWHMKYDILAFAHAITGLHDLMVPHTNGYCDPPCYHQILNIAHSSDDEQSMVFKLHCRGLTKLRLRQQLGNICGTIDATMGVSAAFGHGGEYQVLKSVCTGSGTDCAGTVDAETSPIPQLYENTLLGTHVWAKFWFQGNFGAGCGHAFGIRGVEIQTTTLGTGRCDLVPK